MTPYPRIFISAGEHSGDVIGAGLAREILKRAPDARISGLGGSRMADAGVRLVADTTRHAGMGVLYVLRHLGDWAGVYRRCVAEFNRERPDVVVPIDNPGFNLGKGGFGGIAGLAADRGAPVCYYVSPQVWAWWSWRIRRIARMVERMLTILPFEESLYRERGVDCRYVGHPSFDHLSRHKLDERFLSEMSSGDGPVVGLLPGSRRQEAAHTFPIIAAAAGRIRREMPEARFHVAAVAREHLPTIREAVRAAGLTAQVHLGKTPEIMKASHLCLVCSGTATLETAWFGTPMVIVYRTAAWHRFVVPLFLNVKHIGLVNVVGGKEVVPEFLKFDDDPTPVARAALRLLREDGEYDACKRRIKEVTDTMGSPGSFGRAAEAVLEMVGR